MPPTFNNFLIGQMITDGTHTGFVDSWQSTTKVCSVGTVRNLPPIANAVSGSPPTQVGASNECGNYNPALAGVGLGDTLCCAARRGSFLINK